MAQATDAQKLKIVSDAYAKIKSQNVVLKRAVIDEQKKNASNTEKLASLQKLFDEKNAELRQKELKLRRVQEDNDALTFSTQSLTKRIALLQGQKGSSNSSTNNNNNNNNNSNNVGMDSQAMLVLQQELQSKIQENAQLHNQIVELTKQHSNLLSEQIEQVKTLKEQLEQSKNQNNELSTQLKTVQGESIAQVATTNAELEQIKQELTKKENENEDLKAQLQQAISNAAAAATTASTTSQSLKSVNSSGNDVNTSSSSSSSGVGVLLAPSMRSDMFTPLDAAHTAALLERNVHVPPHARAHLHATTFAELRGALATHDGDGTLAHARNHGNGGSSASNSGDQTSSLVACEADRLVALERALDAQNRANNAGVELISHNSSAIAAARAAHESLRALLLSAAALAGEAAQGRWHSNETSVATVLDSARAWAHDTQAAAVAVKQACVTAAEQTSVLDEERNALKELAECEERRSKAVLVAVDSICTWRRMIARADEANDAALTPAIALLTLTRATLRDVVSANSACAAARQRQTAAARKAGNVLPDTLVALDVLVSSSLRVNAAWQRLLDIVTRLTSYLLPSPSPYFVAGAQHSLSSDIDARGATQIATRQTALRHVALDFNAWATPQTGRTKAGGVGSNGNNGASSTDTNLISELVDNEDENLLHKRYSLSVVDEQGNTNPQIRLSAHDRDREREVKLFYEQKSAQLRRQIELADAKALEAQLELRHQKSLVDELRSKLR